MRGRKENALFNDAQNTFYLRLCGVGHMVKDHSVCPCARVHVCVMCCDESVKGMLNGIIVTSDH